jgi:hypothetical protein
MTTDEIMKLAVTYRSEYAAFLVGDELTAARMDAAHAALRTAVDALVAERDALREALKDIAIFGTRHDTNPTRLLASMQTNELAATIDSWWLSYFQRADEQVRAIARAALKVKP